MNELRVGKFTSSQIHKLLSNGKKDGEVGKPFLSYIEEKNLERQLGISLDTECSARPVTWGSVCEKYVLEDLLGTEYRPQHKGTILHPQYDFWAGTPDCTKFEGDIPKVVSEIKSPYTRLSFGRFLNCKTIDEVREKHPDGDKYYWQVVSNAAITGLNEGELIIFAPRFHELQALRDIAENWDNPEEQYLYKWIAWAHYNELPYIQDGTPNIHKIRFEIPQSDLDRMTGRVLMAGALLTKLKTAA